MTSDNFHVAGKTDDNKDRVGESANRLLNQLRQIHTVAQVL